MMQRFHNPHAAVLKKGLWDFLLWRLGYYKSPSDPMPEGFFYPAEGKPFDKTRPSACWIGHSSYLIEADGVNFLTDPVWDDHCSPVPIPALKRMSQPPMTLQELPRLDFVLISHNHYDHLDLKTVRTLHRLQPWIQWIVSENLSPWFKRRGIENVIELGWWQSHGNITAVPTQHFSGRTLWDTNKTGWNGYVVQVAGKKIYFTGDTGYNPNDFAEIGKRFAPIDLSLIPIGTYWPKEFMQPVHICPEEAVKIHREVGSRFSLGMHWNTFRLSEEPRERPPYDLYLAMQAENLPFETFLPIEIGRKVNF